MKGKNEKKNTFVAENAQTRLGRDARVVEEARLESVYTSKGYPGFESPSLRRMKEKTKTINEYNKQIN